MRASRIHRRGTAKKFLLAKNPISGYEKLAIAAEDHFLSEKNDFLSFQNTAATFHRRGGQKHFLLKIFQIGSFLNEICKKK